MSTFNHPHSDPSGHLSPCPGERKTGRYADAFQNADVFPAWVPFPRAGGEVARKVGVGVLGRTDASTEMRN